MAAQRFESFSCDVVDLFGSGGRLAYDDHPLAFGDRERDHIALPNSRNAFGVKLRLVTGYPGTAEIALALERGEVDGRASWSWSSLKSLKADWITGKKVNLPLQLNLTKNPELPDVPMITDFAQNDRQRQSLRIILSRQTMGRPFMAPPGLPDDRKLALRKAFDDTMKDKAFLAEAHKLKIDIDPMTGAELGALVEKVSKTPAATVKRVRDALEAK